MKRTQPNVALVIVAALAVTITAVGCGSEQPAPSGRGQVTCEAAIRRIVAAGHDLGRASVTDEAVSHEFDAAHLDALTACATVAEYSDASLALNPGKGDTAGGWRALLSDTICPQYDPSNATRVCADLAGVVTATSARTGASASAVTAEATVAAFRAAGLEASSSRTMTRDDYGLAPLVGHGVRFLIPSLCRDCGGRAFTGRPEELKSLKQYYDDFGKRSAALYSYTFLNEAAGVLVQLNGDLPDAEAAKYEKVVNGL